MLLAPSAIVRRFLLPRQSAVRLRSCRVLSSVAAVRSNPFSSPTSRAAAGRTFSAQARTLQSSEAQENVSASPAEPISSQVVLRPYQQEAVGACREALARGLTRIGVSSPTGSGKTTMFMSLIPALADWTPPIQQKGHRGQTLIVVGSVELALQAEAAARRILGPDWTVEVEQSRRRATGIADVYG